MHRVEMSPYERTDLLKVLDFALEEYEFRSRYERNKQDKELANFWTIRIKELKKVVEGKVNPPSMTKHD